MTGDPTQGAFQLFPDLPYDLRRMIWKATIQNKPRLLPTPPIFELSVCKEARSVLLETYEPCFQQNDTLARFPSTSIYANFATDILFLDREQEAIPIKPGTDVSKAMLPEAIEKLQYFATSNWLGVSTKIHSGWQHSLILS